MKKLTRAVFKAKIEDGKLVFDNERYLRTIISNYEDTAKVRVIVEKEGGTRSLRQLHYYWGIVLKYIAEYMGEREEDLHEIFKAKFLKTRRQWRGGEMTILKSTTDLTSDEFGTYIDRCIQEGSELGVVIPVADKDYYVKEQFPEHF